MVALSVRLEDWQRRHDGRATDVPHAFERVCAHLFFLNHAYGIRFYSHPFNRRIAAARAFLGHKTISIL